MEAPVNRRFKFADFELDGTKRLLSKNGQPITLHSKAFDLLLTLVEHRGEVLSKDRLLDTVWAGQFVEEGNLKVQISALRKVFGERNGDHRFIVTVPGRGYSFVAELDDEGNSEILIESHRVSLLTISESSTTAENDRGKTTTLVKNRFLPYALAFGLLVVLGGASLWYYESRILARQKTQVPANPSRIEPTENIFSTSGGGFAERATISPDGKSLAYVEGRKGQTSLWLGDIESNHSVQIIPFEDRIYRYLSFTPDGKYIYFTAVDANHPKLTLRRVSVFGGAIQEMMPEVESFFTFSPKGNLLAYIRTKPGAKQREIVIADSASGSEVRAFQPGASLKEIFGSGISWSPDGATIVFAGTRPDENGTTLFGLDRDNGNITKIAEPVSDRIVNLAWLRDGSGLLINRNSANDARDGKIWLVSYPQREIERITGDTQNYSLFNLSTSSDGLAAVTNGRIDPEIWIAPGGDLARKRQLYSGTEFRGEGLRALAQAPDGKILFTGRSANSESIWEIDANNGDQRQLTTTQDGVVDAQLEVTSNNRYLVFESNRSGKNEIWRANRDGSDLKQLTDGGNDSEPAVSRDGLSVIYTSRGDGKATLWRVSIDGGEPEQLTKQSCSWPAISPDGSFIACATGRTEGSSDTDSGIGLMRSDGGGFLKVFHIPFAGILYNRMRWSPDGKAVIYKDTMQGLWRQDLDGGPPIHLPELEDFRVIHLGSSASNVIFSGGRKVRNIIILGLIR